MRYLATIVFAALLSNISFAQHQHSTHFCGSDIYFEQQAAQNPQLLIEREQQISDFNENSSNEDVFAESVLHVIPVVVHVMYYNFEDSISVAQIEDAIQVLNEDYGLTNNDASNLRPQFQSVQANMEFEFRLAKIDPNGNSTSGINYQQSDRSLDANNAIKSELNWPNNKYLNIWVVRAIDLGLPPEDGTILGYAAFPTSNQATTADGVVIRHDQMGRIGTAISNGRTLTHELGHYLNLYHPFQFGCSSNGDLVSDTPPVRLPSYGCNFSKTDCGNQTTMIENYMDYTDDVCVNTFTTGQKARSKSAMTNSSWNRGGLTTTTNLNATGVGSAPVTAAPTSWFSVESQTTCVGEPLDFINLSASYTGTATYSWTFTSSTGVTVNSTQENPSVTFTQSGTYAATLTVTNSAGSDSHSKTRYIKVLDGNEYDNNFTATFETDIPNFTWQVFDDGDGRTWQTSTAASFAGSRSAVMPTFNTLASGEDILQSTAISLDQTTFATLNFNYAWARRDNANQDRLTVEVSQDCGNTWQVARIISSFNLNTASGNVPNSPFVPTASEWKNASIPLDSYIGPDPILIRFDYLSDGGNNLYIDEVTTAVSIGLDEERSASLNVYPNPANDELYISLTSGSDADWNLTNLSGQTVLNGTLEQGQATIEVSDLPKGIYVLQVTSQGVSKIERVILQ